MYHYAIALELDAEQGASAIWRTVLAWLQRSRRETIELEQLLRNGESRLGARSKLEVQYSDSESPYLHAVRYSHPDQEVAGRRWVTEIGLRVADGAPSFQVSVALLTEDVASTALPPIRPTRPVLVRDLLAKNRPGAAMPGRRLVRLTQDNAEEVKTELFSIQRAHSAVVVSPTTTGKYLIDSTRVQEVLCGLASVYEIAPAADPRRLRAVLGDAMLPWMGGLRIVYPPSEGPYADQPPIRRISPEQIDDWRIAGEDAAGEMLAIVAKRAIRPTLARHLTVEQVRDERTRRSIARNRRDASSAVATLRDDIGLLEQMIVERQLEIEGLEKLLDDREIQLEIVGDDLRKRDHDFASIKLLLAAKDSRPLGPVVDANAQIAMVATLRGEFTVSQALAVAKTVFHDRLVVLDSAEEAAERSNSFHRPEKVLELLLLLGGEYWEALASGQADATARKVFGSSYAATESERVETSSVAIDRRTFLYRGESVVMLAHLKLGRKDSVAETLRIHFHWDAKNGVIVVGHCGPHLDFD